MKRLKYIKPRSVIIKVLNTEHLLLTPSKFRLDSTKDNIIYSKDANKNFIGPVTRKADLKVDGGVLDGAKVNPWGSWEDD